MGGDRPALAGHRVSPASLCLPCRWSKPSSSLRRPSLILVRVVAMLALDARVWACMSNRCWSVACVACLSQPLSRRSFASLYRSVCARSRTRGYPLTSCSARRGSSGTERRVRALVGWSCRLCCSAADMRCVRPRFTKVCGECQEVDRRRDRVEKVARLSPVLLLLCRAPREERAVGSLTQCFALNAHVSRNHAGHQERAQRHGASKRVRLCSFRCLFSS